MKGLERETIFAIAIMLLVLLIIIASLFFVFRFDITTLSPV